MHLHLALPARCEGGRVGGEKEEINENIPVAMHSRTMLGYMQFEQLWSHTTLLLLSAPSNFLIWRWRRKERGRRGEGKKRRREEGGREGGGRKEEEEEKGRGRRKKEGKEERGAREEYMHVTEKMLKLTAYQADPRLSVWECTSALPGREEIEISVVIRAACDV